MIIFLFYQKLIAFDKTFAEIFYMKDKEEYYSTPLYLYDVLRKDTDKESDEGKKNDETRVYLELEKDISKTKLKMFIQVQN